jgi:hypothetical protein
LTALQKAGLGTPQNGIFSGLINTEKWSVKLILDFFAKPSTIYPKIYQEGKTMMIQNILRLATAALIFISIPAHAEFYQYEDKNGVVHYTDNFATIPEQYRSQISSHPETPPVSPLTTKVHGKIAKLKIPTIKRYPKQRRRIRRERIWKRPASKDNAKFSLKRRIG